MNQTACTYDLLAVGRNYSQRILPGRSVTFGSGYDITRTDVSLDQGDTTSFLVQMPVSQYYSTDLRRDALALGAGTLPGNAFSGVFVSVFLGFPMAYTTLWSINTTASSVDVYVSSQLPLFSPVYGATKFGGRVLVTLYILWLMWVRYYRAYLHLKRNILDFGLENGATSFEIILGDPTSIILVNPLVAAAFLVDTVSSVDYLSRCMVRVCQVNDLVVFGLATLYLSRTLWFAYAGLGVASVLLKKVKTVRFAALDTTTTALAVSVLAGPLTYLQSRTMICIDLYFWAGTGIVRVPVNTIETVFMCVIYISTIALLPIAVGIVYPLLRPPRDVRSLSTMATLAVTQDLKKRCILALSTTSLCRRRRVAPKTSTRSIVDGGTFHVLAHQYPMYRNYLCMSQKSADCHVLCTSVGQPQRRVCLTLLLFMDIPVVPAMEPAAVGTIQGDAIGAHVIHQGRRASPWVQ